MSSEAPKKYGENAYPYARPSVAKNKGKENWLDSKDADARLKEYEARAKKFKSKPQSIDDLVKDTYTVEKNDTLHLILTRDFKMNDRIAFLTMIKLLQEGVNVDAVRAGDKVSFEEDGKVTFTRGSKETSVEIKAELTNAAAAPVEEPVPILPELAPLAPPEPEIAPLSMAGPELNKSGDILLAIDAYKKSLENNPLDEKCRREGAEFALANKDYGAALELAQTIADDDKSTSKEKLFFLQIAAKAQENLGDNTAAIGYYEKLVPLLGEKSIARAAAMRRIEVLSSDE